MNRPYFGRRTFTRDIEQQEALALARWDGESPATAAVPQIGTPRVRSLNGDSDVLVVYTPDRLVVAGVLRNSTYPTGIEQHHLVGPIPEDEQETIRRHFAKQGYRDPIGFSSAHNFQPFFPGERVLVAKDHESDMTAVDSGRLPRGGVRYAFETHTVELFGEPFDILVAYTPVEGQKEDPNARGIVRIDPKVKGVVYDFSSMAHREAYTLRGPIPQGEREKIKQFLVAAGYQGEVLFSPDERFKPTPLSKTEPAQGAA